MDLTYVSLLLFFLITVAYFYYFKQEVDFTASDDNYGEYTSSNMTRLGLYFIVVLLQQYIFNLISTVNKCGGTVGKNILSTLILTIIPWVLIFGSVIMMLIVYPGLKSSFADVVGYFFIYEDANNILGSIIVDTNLEETLNNSLGQNSSETKPFKIAAEAIMKLCGNKGILVNAMNPVNFENIWSVLQPLVVPEVKADAPKLNNFKSQLKELVYRKDNIGEGMWYIYTGILLSSIVSYNLISRGCEKSLKQIEDAKKKYTDTVKKNEPKKLNDYADKPYQL